MNNITIKEFLSLLLNNKKKIIAFVSFWSIISFIYLAFIATPYYKSIARVYPVHEASLNQNKLLNLLLFQ